MVVEFLIRRMFHPLYRHPRCYARTAWLPQEFFVSDSLEVCGDSILHYCRSEWHVPSILRGHSLDYLTLLDEAEL